MIAQKCDRCGKLFEREHVPDITVRKYTHGYGEYRLDLCPDCQKELERWLKFKFDGKRQEENETP